MTLGQALLMAACGAGALALIVCAALGIGRRAVDL